MTTRLQLFISAICLFPMISEAQTPVIDAPASDFILFTSDGGLVNNGASLVTGDIGTGKGDITGFGALVVLFGASHEEDGVTDAAIPQVTAAYNSFPAGCGTTLTTPIVSQTLGRGTYCNGGATSLTGDLILDGGNNPGVPFIFKIGGALSTGIGSSITLINGALISDVYFQVDGAVSLGLASVFRGTIIARGAIELGGGSRLVGRALTTAGAITVNTSVVIGTDTPLPVTLTSFNVRKSEGQTALLSWTTTSETNSDRFDIEHSIMGKVWEKIGAVAANGESVSLASYSFNTQVAEGGVHLYRLKMIDQDNSFAYSSIRKVDFGSLTRSVMYPNPVINKLTLDVPDRSQVERIQFQSISGKILYDESKSASSNVSETMDVTNFPSGMYVVKITRTKGQVDYLKILKL